MYKAEPLNSATFDVISGDSFRFRVTTANTKKTHAWQLSSQIFDIMCKLFLKLKIEVLKDFGGAAGIDCLGNYSI